MRITNQYRYSQALYDYQRNMEDVVKNQQQITSGLKIQESYEGASTYSDAMRLDYEAQTLSQVIEATSKSVSFAKNTDSSLQSFEKQLENFKTKLIQAANNIHDVTSREAIANDLKSIREHLVNIANTSVNGQFLFAGSAVSTRPIDTTGKYQGNNEQMKTHGGSQVEIPYNIPGSDIFLGRDNDYNKLLTTNVNLIDNTKLNPTENPKYLNGESKIKQMIGMNYASDSASQNPSINRDYDFGDDSVRFPNTYFYLQGKKPDGTSFTSKFSVTADSSIQSLMEKIGMEFGNTAGTKVVDVTINNQGQFNVKDLTKGNQAIEFQMVAATEISADKSALATTAAKDAAGTSLASVDTLNDLQTAANAGRVHITEFTKNKFFDKDGNKTDSFDYDKVRFGVKDNTVTSSVAQVVKSNGEYAKDSTRLSEVAGTSQLYPLENSKYNIDDKELTINVTSKNGTNYTIRLNLGHEANQATSTPAQAARFSVVGERNGVTTNYGPFAVRHADQFGDYETGTKDVTFKQINDIIAMAASENIPTANTYDAYNRAIELSRGSVEVNMTTGGKIELTDKANSVTPIRVAMYDSTQNSDRFYGDSTGTTPATSQGGGSVFTFSANNAVAIDEPSIDMFADLDKMIEAVRQGYYRAGSENDDPRNTGIQGALERIDHLIDRANKELTKIGSQTQLLTVTNERASTMKVNVETVRSNVIDADYAQAYLQFTQKTLAYQAMLQATSKINQLSLLNYM